MVLFPHGFKKEFDFLKIDKSWNITIPISFKSIKIDKDLFVRRIGFWVQKITRGFSDDELWSLDYTCAKWLLPRLKEFKKIKLRVLADENRKKELENELGEVIWFLEKVIKCEKGIYPDDLCREKKAAKLFGKIFPTLWY